MLIETHYPVVEAELSDKHAKLIKGLINPTHKLYSQYQPQVIAEILRLLLAAKDDNDYIEILKMCIGCGGGKSNIFLLVSLISLLEGTSTKIFITAPSKLLLTQYRDDLHEMISFGHASGVLPKDWTLSNLEISSNEKPNKKIKKVQAIIDDLDDPEYTDNLPEVKEFIKHRHEEYEKQEKIEHCINYEIVPRTNSVKIKKALDYDQPLLVFACKPSAIEFAKNILNKYDRRVFDFVVHDEVHYWQGATLKSPSKDAIRIISEHSKVILNTTATFKTTNPAFFNHDDILLGRTIADIPTVALKEWGIIKSKLIVKIVSIPQNFYLEDSEKEVLLNNKVDARRFYKEWAVIVQVLRDQLKVFQETGNCPHVITAGSSVPINKQLMVSGCEFSDSVNNIFPESLISEVNGGTKTILKTTANGKIKSRTANQASLTIQHSCYTAGVNITNFNVAVLLREMCEITLNQFVNRVTRKHDDYDTAYVYYAVEENETAQNRLKKFFNKLWEIGLMIGDIEIEVLNFSGVGESQIMSEDIKDGLLTEHNISGIVNDLIYKIKEEREIDELRAQIDKIASGDELAADYKKFLNQ